MNQLSKYASVKLPLYRQICGLHIRVKFEIELNDIESNLYKKYTFTINYITGQSIVDYI